MSMGRYFGCATLALGFGVLAASAKAEDKMTIGFVTHSQGDPFIQQIIDGAQAAANDLGVTLKVAQQQGAAPDGQLKLVQNIVNAGAQGVATSVPGDSMANSLNDIIASGVPIVQFNLLSAAVKAPYVGEKSTQSGRILGKAIVDKLVGVGGVQLAEARDVRGAEAHERDSVGICGVELLPMIVILDSADLHIEGAENSDAGRSLERLFDALRAVLEHGQPRKAVAENDLSLRSGAADFFDDRLAENAPTLGGLLADIRRFHRSAQEIVLNDRNAARYDVVKAAGHRIAWNRGRDSLCAGVDDILHELQLTVRRGPLLLRHFKGDSEIVRGGLRAVDDLLNEWVALGVGDKPDRDLALGLGG